MRPCLTLFFGQITFAPHHSSSTGDSSCGVFDMYQLRLCSFMVSSVLPGKCHPVLVMSWLPVGFKTPHLFVCILSSLSDPPTREKLDTRVFPLRQMGKAHGKTSLSFFTVELCSLSPFFILWSSSSSTD